MELLKQCSNKAGFKKLAISPFTRNIHVYPIEKTNTCFMLAVYLPRLSNLVKIMPEIANVGIELTMVHERQHCLGKAFESIDDGYEEDKCEIEPITNQQSVCDLIKKEKSTGIEIILFHL